MMMGELLPALLSLSPHMIIVHPGLRNHYRPTCCRRIRFHPRPTNNQQKRHGNRMPSRLAWKICPLLALSWLSMIWLHRTATRNHYNEEGWPTNLRRHGLQLQDMGASSSLPLPMASFQSLSVSLPKTTIDGVRFPRGENERSYMGTGLWNSRVSLPKALMAMLGSESAYVETPLFTICRLQLQHGSDRNALEEAMRQELFMTNDIRRDWLGYFVFMKEYESQNLINCTMQDGRRLDETAAAKRAQHILDRKFQNASYDELANLHVKALRTEFIDEPHDLLYATTYPYVAAQYYGPSVLVMEPDERGLDLGYYGAMKRRNDNASITSCVNFPREDPADAGEIITPGYKMPNSVTGFEIRRQASASDYSKVEVGQPYHTGREVPSISHAFYKETLPEGTAVFLLRFPPGEVHCAIPTNDTYAKGAFFECNHGGKVPEEGHCVLSKDNGDFSKPLQTVGFIFDEAFQGGCASAESLLLGLSAEHRDSGENAQYLYSQMFQDVVSTVSAKLGRDIFMAHFASPGEKIQCKKVYADKQKLKNLWQKHRQIASLHVGLDTHYSTCAALLPLLWSNDGLEWKATVVAETQSNPLNEEIFAVAKGEPSTESSHPNWRWLLGSLQQEERPFCGGFKGSLCEVELIANQSIGIGTVSFNCQLECTYAGAWFASIDDPLRCHSFARHLLTFVVPNSGRSTFIGINGRRHNERNGGDFEALRLSQANLDPLHWRQRSTGSLNVFMSADLHGFIHGNCDGSFCSSGASSFASVIETIRLSSAVTRSPTLVVDAGDALFGSGAPPKDVIDAMSTLGYDAMALGNHELDIGVSKLQELTANANFLLLAANAKINGMDSLSRVLVRGMVIGGKLCRVCVTGLTSPEPNPLAGSELSFINSTDDIVAEVNAISRDNACDIQILLSHMGFKDDKAIALLSGADSKFRSPLSLIIGGHSHFIFGSVTNDESAESGDTILEEHFPFIQSGVPIAHIGSNGMYAGIFDIQPFVASRSGSGPFGQRTEVNGALQPLGVEYGVFPSLKVAFPTPKVELPDGLGLINIEIHPESASVCTVSCRRGECLAGNMVTDAMRKCVQSSDCVGNAHLLSDLPHIALLESGTLRSCLRKPKDDMSTLLPWPNKLVVITMKGSAVRSMLEHGLMTKTNAQGGGFLQTSGLQYTYMGNNVLEAWLVEDVAQVVTHQSKSDHTITFHSGAHEKIAQKKQVLQDNEFYRVIVSDWLASGGDGFGHAQGGVATKYLNTTLREALYFYSSKSPLIRTEKRIVDYSVLHRKSSMKNSIAAIFGSFAASILSFPLYSRVVLKVTSRDGESSKIHLWNGAVLATLAGTMSNAIFFTIFFHTALFRRPFLRAVFAGFINGKLSTCWRHGLPSGVSHQFAASVLATNPLWVVITRLQMSTTKRITACGMARRIIRDEGYLGFLDGLSWNLFMIIYPTIRQLALDLLRRIVLCEGHTMEGIRGLAASCMATIVTYPIQRWRIQSQAAMPCRVTGLFDGVHYKLLHSGVAGFILFAALSGSYEALDLILG